MRLNYLFRNKDNRNEILRQLDKAASSNKFPSLSLYNYYYIDGKLTAYADTGSNWLILFEMSFLTFDIDFPNNIITSVYCFSNLIDFDSLGLQRDMIYYPILETNLGKRMAANPNSLIVDSSLNSITTKLRKINLPKEVVSKSKDILILFRNISDNLFKDDLFLDKQVKDDFVLQKAKDIVFTIDKTFDKWQHPTYKEKPSQMLFFQELTKSLLSNTLDKFVFLGDTNSDWQHARNEEIEYELY